MRRPYSKRKRILMIPVFVLGFLALFSLFSFVVMFLWNAIFPQVLNVGTITFWQAAGILLLAKILFGGFGGRKHRRGDFRQRMFERWEHMTPEEREKFKEKMKARRERWCGPFAKEEAAQGREAGAE